MASGVNKVIILGRLGQDPEVRYTSSGSAVANFGVATNESWTDKQGQKQERTEWHRIVVWGKTAEICGQYLSKGRQAYFEGKLQTREWMDKDNNKRYTTEIVAQTVQFVGDRGQNQAASGPSMSNDFAPSQGGGGGSDMAPPPMDDGMGGSGDEVPF